MTPAKRGATKKSVKKSVRKKPVKKTPPDTDKVVASSTEPDVTTPEPVTSAPDLDNPIYKHPGWLVAIVLILGWSIDFLFWDRDVGVNFPIFLLLGLLGGIYWLSINKIYPAKSSLWLLAPFLFFAVFSFLRREPLTVFLTFTFAILSIGLFGSSYVGGRWFKYGLLDFIYKFFVLLGDAMVGVLIYFPKAKKIQAEMDSGKSGFPIWGLLRGLLFALPILLCFGSLLAAGDLVFEAKLDEFFNLDDLAENINRGILILLYGYLMAGTFIHSALKSGDKSLFAEKSPVIKPFFGFTETTVILASVSILFLAFVIVQFQYFFGGETNIGIEGYTYSQYPRRGFNELVAVAFFSLVLILGLSSISQRENESQRRIYSGLSIALAVLVEVILVSAFRRISLGIDWHGYSRFRLYPSIFLVWLGLLFVVVVILEYTRREQYFAFAALLASVGFAVSLTLFNVDDATVKHNILRTLQGKNLNVSHLASLSEDAVPALAEEFYSDDYSQEVHEGIGAALTCYLNKESIYAKSVDDWRAFNLSSWNAYNALQEVESDLQDYGINDERWWDVEVRTPSDKWYDCVYRSSSEED